MKTRKVYDIKSGKLLGITGNTHFGYDLGVGRIRFHSLFCPIRNNLFVSKDGIVAEKPADILPLMEKEHKYCLKLPFKMKMRKDLYSYKCPNTENQ